MPVRRALHAALVVVGNMPLLLAYFGIMAAMWLYAVADRLWPGATRGNCWSFALARAWRRGGHIAIRPVRQARLLFGIGVAYHAAWTPRLHGDVEQTEPRERYRGPSLLWRWMYFTYDVHGADSKPMRAWSDTD